MDTMSKQRRPKSQPASPGEPLSVYVRMDLPTSAALVAFVESQPVAPSNAAVCLKALHEFLARHGFWPPPATPPKGR